MQVSQQLPSPFTQHQTSTQHQSAASVGAVGEVRFPGAQARAVPGVADDGYSNHAGTGGDTETCRHSATRREQKAPPPSPAMPAPAPGVVVDGVQAPPASSPPSNTTTKHWTQPGRRTVSPPPFAPPPTPAPAPPASPSSRKHASVEGEPPGAHPPVSPTLLEQSLQRFYEENSPDKLYKVASIVGKFVAAGATHSLLNRLNAGPLCLSLPCPLRYQSRTAPSLASRSLSAFLSLTFKTRCRPSSHLRLRFGGVEQSSCARQCNHRPARGATLCGRQGRHDRRRQPIHKACPK